MSLINTASTDTQRLFSVYIYYRLALGLMLGLMHWSGLAKDVFGYGHPQLFTNISLLYITVCSISLLLYWAKVLRAQNIHLLAVLIFDFIALVIMIYASGNVTGGLGYLSLIPMAVGSTFLRGRTHVALAAFAAILVLGMNLLNIHDGIGESRDFFSAGITGVLLFVTAIAFRLLSERVKSSEYTAQKQTEQADYSQLISQRIVETMRTGIIVVDRNLRIQLINHAAASLLTVNNRFQGILHIFPIHQCLEQWKNDGIIPSSFNFSLEDEQELKVSFAPLEDAHFPSLMLFIEDTQRLNQAAQQLKLASLGRLTASIAHEIRNPLGAISHAGQLLEESEQISDGDKELLHIIHKNSQRINIIINNILDFSRRKNTTPEMINLNQWLHDFKAEYLQHHSGDLQITADKPKIYTKVDASHLYQIMNNLTDNGFRYSFLATKQYRMHFHISIQQKDQRPYIDIIDFGYGITEDDRDKIFEPFYTTESTGSGLGLYLCKELSEANQAHLSYSYDNNKSAFKLTLAHPQRKIELQ